MARIRPIVGPRYNPRMPRKGMKLKDLARELGVTSRTLIIRCRAEGLFVQNSITKLSPPDADRIRTWFRPVTSKPRYGPKAGCDNSL